MKRDRPPYRDRITADSAVMAGKPVVTGTRIPVELVVSYVAENPDLTIDDVKACLAYAQTLVAGEEVTPAPGPYRE